MDFKYESGRWCWGVLSSLALSAAASAAPTYGNIIDPPGVYFGTGNLNGNWTIDTSNNVEVALRIKDRATLATIDGSSGVYYANPGLCNPTCSGGPKANWNYEFSVNTRADGTGTLDLTQVFFLLELDQNPTAATSFNTINSLGNWGDNSYWSGSERTAAGANPLDDDPLAGEYGAQQSANPMFGDSGYGYLPGPGLYDLRLSVYTLGTGPNGSGGSLLASTTAQVQVVPEPGSLALAGLAMFGLVAARRRRL